MKRVLVLLLASVWATPAGASCRTQRKITTDEAEALVMASLSAQQHRLPNVGVIPDDSRSSAKFIFFMVIWEGTRNGSVMVGNFAVDPYTGDVFDSVVPCYEMKNKTLQALQTRIRADLHLSESEYQRLKTKGPLCDEK